MPKYSTSRTIALLASVLAPVLLVATNAHAALTFSANEIESDGVLTVTTSGGLTSLQPFALGADADAGVGADGAGYVSDLSIADTFTDATQGVEPLSLSTTVNFSADGGNVYAFPNYLRIPSSNTKNVGDFYANYTLAEQSGSGNVTTINGVTSVARQKGSGSISDLIPFQATAQHQGSGAVTTQQGVRILNSITSAAAASATVGGQYGVVISSGTSKAGTTVDLNYGIWVGTPSHVGTINNSYSFFANDLAGVATNPYYFWFDSRGVGRCKEDSTFNSVGQSICVVYNPQFAKYTAGAANYERIVYGQWNSNVAEIGAEAGGTGTQRDLRLIGDNIRLGSDSLIIEQSRTPASASATCTTGTVSWDADYVYVCVATNTWKRSAISTW